MSLLNDILAWTQYELKPWQSDAVRRLFHQQSLSNNDIEDLYALLKIEHGIPDPKDRKPMPLDEKQLPAASTIASSVVLLALRDLKNVNRIANGQHLDFAPEGLTIIYGGNASGKSGYSRVLKRACRARNQEENVLPNAMLDISDQGIPEATFNIKQNDKMKSFTWRNDATAPDLLSAISVFDMYCARAYLDEEQDVAFVPYGLDVVENLAQEVLPKVSALLEKELRSTEVDFTQFDDLLGPTEVGKAIANLSKAPDAKLIEKLATISDTDKKRLVELDKILKETDPKNKAKSIKLTIKRISELLQRISKATKVVDHDMLTCLQTLDEETEAAVKAQNTAAADFRVGEVLLPGTGEKTWRALFEAARKYSTEVAYPGLEFPVISDDAKCPLCQQQLTAVASARLMRFNEFVRNDIATLTAAKTQERRDKQDQLSIASIGLNFDDPLAEEFAQHDDNIPKEVRNFEQRLSARLDWLREALKNHRWDNPPELTGDPSDNLTQLSVKLTSELNALMDAADETQRKLLESERNELSTRVSLNSRKKTVIDAISKYDLHCKLLNCKNALKTRPISDKSKELTHKAVTETLRDALNKEFEALGVGHLKTALKDRTVAGKTKHKLVLDLPTTARIDEILSEGEQRAISIGSFLAELSLAGHTGAIVFDDPVSSLDHIWRQKVANRLVEESKKRQVIIFTHDTVFLGELRDVTEKTNVNFAVHHLEWESGNPGVVRSGLPWEHKSCDERIDELEKLQKKLDKSWSVYPEADARKKMRRAYSDLRATIERVIQDIVFAGVIQQYRDWIRVHKLSDAVGFDKEEYNQIAKLYRECCNFTEAHDSSSAKIKSVPDPKALSQNIDELKAVIEKIRARRKNATQADAS